MAASSPVSLQFGVELHFGDCAVQSLARKGKLGHEELGDAGVLQGDGLEPAEGKFISLSLPGCDDVYMSF